MKFIVNRNLLLQALNHTRCYMDAGNSPFQFKNIFQITVIGGHLTVTGTSGLLFKSEQIELCEEVKDAPRTFYVTASMFVKTIRSLDDQPLEFLVEEYQLTVTHSDGYFRLPIYDSQFPEPKAMTDDKLMHLHLEAPGLRSQLSKVAYATDDNDLRPALSGVLMEIDNDSITYIATDARYLVRLIKKCKDANGFISSFILPRYAVDTLLRLLPATGYCELYFQNPIGEHKLPLCKAVINDTLTLWFDCIDSRYPDYKKVIPTDFMQSFTASRRQLIKMLNRISLFAPGNYQVRIQLIGDNKIELESHDRDEVGDYMSVEQIPCTIHEKLSPLCSTVYCDVRKLIKILRNMCSEQVRFNLNAGERAFTICPVPQPDVEEITALLMPMTKNQDY